MLEYNLIQQHKPRFNIRYRDDKSYPYLALTVGEKWPRAQVLRGTKRKGVRYFGPYGHAWAIRDTLDALTRVFPVRTCSNAFFDQRARAKRPCLYYDIGRCAGPCVPETTGVTEESYRAHVEAMGEFLAGNARPVLRRLETEMRASSEGQEFEQAARFRDQLFAARRALESQEMVLTPPEDLDVVALVEDDLEAAVQVFYVRRGRVLGRRGWVVDRVEDLDRPGLIASFLEQLYMERQEVPPRVLVQAMPAGAELLEAWLTARRGKPVRIAVPSRGAEAASDGGRRAQRRRRLPAPQAPARLRLRRALARARRARRAARPGPGAPADRVLRHLQPRRDRQGRLDGGVRGRATQASGLPEVQDHGRAGAGRLRLDVRDAPPPVHALARGAGAPAGGAQATVLLPAGARRRGRRPGPADAGERGARRARAVDPAHRAREASGGGLLPRPSRPPRDPARLGGVVRAPAHPRRGAPHRCRLPPFAPREARAPLAAGRHPGRRPHAEEGAAQAVRIPHEAARRVGRGDRRHAGRGAGRWRRPCTTTCTHPSTGGRAHERRRRPRATASP